MNGADRIVTTSRREGFGMSFLESWLFGKPVVGRNIGYVTQDFKEEGLVLENLYDKLPVETPEGARDFAELEPEGQRRVIRRLMGSSEERGKLLAETGIRELLFRKVSADARKHNRAIIEEKYSLESYGKRLARVYEAMSIGSASP